MREQGEEILSDVDDKLLVSEALRDTAIKYFQYVGLGKSCTKKFLYSYFSTRWAEYNATYGKLGKRTKSLSDTILKAQDRIANLDSLLEKDFQVAAVAFPYERSLGQIVVTDTIDLISLNKIRSDGGATEVNITVFDSNISNSNASSFPTRIRALMSLAYARRELLGSDLNINTKVVNLFNGTHQMIDLTREHRFNYPRLLRNIAHQCSADLFYPTSLSTVCVTCPFRICCSWSAA